MSGWCDHIDPPVERYIVNGRIYALCGICGDWIDGGKP